MKDIPLGLYCFSEDNEGKRCNCPHWKIIRTKERYDNGYCSYLQHGDWEGKGYGMLWDQIKDCDVNLDDPDDEYEFLEGWS